MAVMGTQPLDRKMYGEREEKEGEAFGNGEAVGMGVGVWGM